MDLPPAHQNGPPSVPPNFEFLEMRSVTFGYTPTAPPLLKNISLRLAHGQRVALIGRSGSGKSTLARLLTGVLEPREGDILVNDLIVQPGMLSSCATWSEANPALLPGNAQDHVTWGRSPLPSERLADVLKKTGISPALAARALSDENISGGERQRLEMARLLAREPELLILDEATNLIGADLEAFLLDHWTQRGCAWFWITQNPEIARRSDEVWILDGGDIVERGTWNELAQRSERFRQLMEL